MSLWTTEFITLSLSNLWLKRKTFPLVNQLHWLWAQGNIQTKSSSNSTKLFLEMSVEHFDLLMWNNFIKPSRHLELRRSWGASWQKLRRNHRHDLRRTHLRKTRMVWLGRTQPLNKVRTHRNDLGRNHQRSRQVNPKNQKAKDLYLLKPYLS